jgi:hypothetical protein
VYTSSHFSLSSFLFLLFSSFFFFSSFFLIDLFSPPVSQRLPFFSSSFFLLLTSFVVHLSFAPFSSFPIPPSP